MDNFTFQNPTKLVFGKGRIAELNTLIPKGTKVMMTYGGGSIKKNGIYDQVKQALNGYSIIEFGGIPANPEYEILKQAIKICKQENVGFILAVGGGSVIDGTKFIVSGAKYEGDAWDFIQDDSKIKAALPFGTVLTLPATGSEMNSGAVISKRETKEKYAFGSPLCFPQFSILDPTAIYSLPNKQISNGIVDTFIHTMEQYLTMNNKTYLMSRFSEGILSTLIKISPELLKEKRDYDTCANFMICATMGLNGFVAMGVVQDWATHMIGHELTALCGLDHGETLAIVFPGMMRVMRKEKREMILLYARNVWHIDEKDDEKAIDMVIKKTEDFFISLGKKIKLSDYGIKEDVIDTIVTRFKQRNWNVGEFGNVTPDKVRLILESVK
jgi:NADP-dependent alcohol dehydrogenase